MPAIVGGQRARVDARVGFHIGLCTADEVGAGALCRKCPEVKRMIHLRVDRRSGPGRHNGYAILVAHCDFGRQLPQWRSGMTAGRIAVPTPHHDGVCVDPKDEFRARIVEKPPDDEHLCVAAAGMGEFSLEEGMVESEILRYFFKRTRHTPWAG